MSLYREGGLPWLFDPESPQLATVAKEAVARTPDTPCGDLADDTEHLARLLRDRHFGIATGRVALPDVRLPDAQTWGDLAGLQAQLRESLRDRHFRFFGAPADPPGEDGPAVERREIGGVLVIRVRRLYGPPEDDRAFADWVAGADRDFEFERIVVDLRSNIGGNDGHTYAWMERRLRGVERFASDSTWMMGGSPLGNWNQQSWRRALHGTPAPDFLADEIELVEQTHDLPEGDMPWGGRMLVLVDRWSRSSGESSAWLLREGLGARLLGEPTLGMIEYGNICPYVLPRSRLVVALPTKHNDYGFPVETVGFPVDEPLDPETPVEDVARRFDTFV